jgi:hypothetical protein
MQKGTLIKLNPPSWAWPKSYIVNLFVFFKIFAHVPTKETPNTSVNQL